MTPSDQSGRARLFAVAVAAWLLLGAVAGIPAAAATTDAGTGQLGDDDGGLLNETVDSTTDTVDSTVDSTTDAVDDTTDTVAETTDSTTETVDSTVEGTTDTVDTATGGATEDTTDAVTDATDGVTDAADTTTDGVTDAADTTTDEVDAAVGDTTSTTDAVTDDTTDAVSAATEGDLEGTAGSLDDATDETTTLTTDRVTSLAETTGEVTAELTETTGEATTDLAGGTTGALAELGGDSGVSVVGSTAGAAVGNVAGSSPDETLSGGSDDTASSGQAARLESGSDDGSDGPDGATDGTGDGAAGDASGERSVAAEPDGPLLTLGGPGGVPVSEDAATGLGLGALLVGAVGAAVRQASAAGGTGAGTTAARAASTAVASGEGPLSRLARMLSVLRYSRYDDSDPLELDARRAVYEAISDQPGEPITAVSDRADVNLSTARHHVKVLQREELVATARVRNCERFYPAGTEDLELAAAMADECTADILDALVRLEPASVSGLADEVDRSPSTVTHHLQKLEDDEIVVRERAGRSVENKLSEPARAALDPETERRQHAAERRLEAEAERSDAASGASAD
ncbi:helix-turn-helix domain-containing protein [Haloglomus litoreum]|uniref:helix-turn-helix domain-containing protein n=1 Tax=Haloglomus litoreum TaxID=3034026 RepID=UPI0023E75A41|nr:helix-turn-helix domain-containing protein [Haloglomus sp. DT116]